MNAGGPMTEADWTARNPLLDRFQIGLVVDAATGMITKAKLGDGTHHWNDLEWWSPDGGISNTENTTSLPPASANDGTVLPAVQTYDAVGRIVLGQTTAQGTSGSYVRIRASAGGTILATATVGVGATSLTVLNRGAGTAAQYTTQIEAWLELVVTAATVSMLSSATINDIGATNTANVFARFATPTSAAEAVTQRAYVFETDDPSLTFYEAAPQTVYGAGTASCNGVCTFYEVTGGVGAFVYAGSTSPSDDGIRYSGGTYLIYRGSEDKYSITSDAASPSLATGTWTATNGTAPAPTVLGVTYDVEVASRVQIGHGIMAVGTAVVQTNVGTKQALLSAVPTGYKRIIDKVVFRNASASLLSMIGEGDTSVGFDVAASNVLIDGDSSNMGNLVSTAKCVACNVDYPQVAVGFERGLAGEVLGVLFSYNGITATVDIDVWYYDVPA